MVNQQITAKKEVWTILEMVRWGTQYFADKGVDSPRLTIELIVCHVTGLERVGLYTNFEKPLSTTELDGIRVSVRRRVQREPLQYILGSTQFYGIEVSVNSAVLVPRPETELIAEHVAECLMRRGNQSPVVLDIGTGSGCIALALARRFPHARIVAIDKSEKALAVAARNAQTLAVNSVQFLPIDVFCDVSALGVFDVIVSNPPYISVGDMEELQSEVRQFEPHSALCGGKDGLDFYRRFAEIFPTLLKHDGEYCVEIGYGQEVSIASIFEKAGFIASSFRDYAGIVRGVYGTHKEIGSKE